MGCTRLGSMAGEGYIRTPKVKLLEQNKTAANSISERRLLIFSALLGKFNSMEKIMGKDIQVRKMGNVAEQVEVRIDPTLPTLDDLVYWLETLTDSEYSRVTKAAKLRRRGNKALRIEEDNDGK